MRVLSTLALVVVTIVAPLSGRHVQDAPAQDPAGDQAQNMKDVVLWTSRVETALVRAMQKHHPLIEIYVQHFTPHETLEKVPTHDDYFLGRLQWDGSGPKMAGLGRDTTTPKGRRPSKRSRNVQPLPDGFAELMAPDWHAFDPQRYQFTFVRREFLNEARCVVFDIRPLNDTPGAFSGRVWVEDRGFNIVRFNGINRRVDGLLSAFFKRKSSFRVDSWRVNVRPDLWVPSYVYVEETDPRDTLTRPQIKSQMRIWGYESQDTNAQQQFTDILIDEPAVRDNSTGAKGPSPLESQRRWETEAEQNVLARLSAARFLAPYGEVDKLLETVVNNLVVTNKLMLDAPVRCRVLLTAPLESFTVGHTIVLSRGLIDVLPDEASLALILAHQLSHIVLGHRLIDTKFAFGDRLMISDADLLHELQFTHTPAEEVKADDKVVEILKRSPYKNDLTGAGLFLPAVAASATQLRRLIQPQFGEHMADSGQVLRWSTLMIRTPGYSPERADQIAALPLGARLVVNPWDGRVELLRAPLVPLIGPREKQQLAITPFMPQIRYVDTVDTRTAEAR